MIISSTSSVPSEALPHEKTHTNDENIDAAKISSLATVALAEMKTTHISHLIPPTAPKKYTFKSILEFFNKATLQTENALKDADNCLKAAKELNEKTGHTLSELQTTIGSLSFAINDMRGFTQRSSASFGPPKNYIACWISTVDTLTTEILKIQLQVSLLAKPAISEISTQQSQ